MSTALFIAGATLLNLSLGAMILNLLPFGITQLIAGIGESLLTLWAIHQGMHFYAALYAACGAVNFYVWWHRGGGDGTKRRLRSLVRKFTPVRRTAPQVA